MFTEWPLYISNPALRLSEVAVGNDEGAAAERTGATGNLGNSSSSILKSFFAEIISTSLPVSRTCLFSILSSKLSGSSFGPNAA